VNLTGRRASSVPLTLRDVGQHTSDKPRWRRQPVHLSTLCIQDVDHTRTEGDQHIRDHSPMAAPPEDLRTHHSGTQTPRHHQELEKAGRKLFTVEVIGVPAKRGMPPGGVRGIRGRWATASQGEKRDVVDPGGVERRFEHRLPVLRLAAGTGKASDIRDRFNPIPLENGEEVREEAS
jgi:hypothetical protein